MKNLDAPAYPDTRGLSALLSYFRHLQEKRIAEIQRARHEVDELKKLLKQPRNRKKLRGKDEK